MAEYHANIELPGNSGFILSQRNDLKLGASTSGDVFINKDNALRPEIDLGQDLGLPHLRWNNLNVGSINGVPANGPDYLSTFFVGKHGDDSNDGLNPDKPFLTFSAALQAVIQAQNGVVGSGAAIVGVDAGVYEFDTLYIPSNVKLQAPIATLSGQVIGLSDDSILDVKKIVLDSTTTPISQLTGTATIARIPGIANSTVTSPSGTSFVNADEVVALTDHAGGAFVFTLASGVISANISNMHVTSGVAAIASHVDGSLNLDVRNIFTVGEDSLLGAGLFIASAITHNGFINLNASRIESPQYALFGGFSNGTRWSANVGRANVLKAFSAVSTNNVANIWIADPVNSTASTFSAATNTVCVKSPCDVNSSLFNPVDSREASGSIKPDTTLTYDLGDSSKRWASLWAQSGTVHTANIENLTVQGTTQIDDEITLDGDVTINGNIVSNIIPVGDRDLGISTLPWKSLEVEKGNVRSLGVANEANFSGQVNFDATTATERPTINGSGIAVRNEVSPSWEDQYLVATATTGYVEAFEDAKDFNMGFLPMPLAEDCTLSRKFCIASIYATGGNDEWQFVVQKRAKGSLATRTNVASGWFSWSAAALALQTTPSILEGDDADFEFEAGDAFTVVIHNNGSGTTVNTPIARSRIGFTSRIPSSGKGI